MKEANGNPWWTNTEPKNKAKLKPEKQRNLTVIVGFMAIIAAMVGTVAIAPDFSQPKRSEFQAISHPGSTLSVIAECGNTFAFDVPQQVTGAVPEDFFINPKTGASVKRNVPVNPMIVPAYGYFYFEENPKPKKKFYSVSDAKKLPETVQYMNLMWNGWTIIWYKSDIDKDALISVEKFANEHEKVIAMPWTEERNLPMDRNFAFSSWGNSRSCGYWDNSLINDFIKFSQENSPARNIGNPHQALLDEDGELARINVAQW